MDYLLALLQGLGIAAAIGIRPFLPVLLAGALAAADLGIDFEGTDFSFLEGTGIPARDRRLGRRLRLRRPPARRRAERDDPVVCVLLVVSLVLGALLAAGSIDDVSGTLVARRARRCRRRVARLRGRALAVRPRPRAPRPGRAGRAADLRRRRRTARRRRSRSCSRRSRSSSSSASPGCSSADSAARARSTRACGSSVMREASPCGLVSLGAIAQRAILPWGGPCKKLVLAVIDAMKPAMLERAIATGRAPTLERLIQQGQYTDECVAAFPSVTPVCAASIATGTRAGRARDPGHELVAPGRGALRRVRDELRRLARLRHPPVAHGHDLQHEPRAPLAGREDGVRGARRQRDSHRGHDVPDVPRPPPARAVGEHGALAARPHRLRPADVGAEGALLRRHVRVAQDVLPLAAGPAGRARPALGLRLGVHGPAGPVRLPAAVAARQRHALAQVRAVRAGRLDRRRRQADRPHDGRRPAGRRVPRGPRGDRLLRSLAVQGGGRDRPLPRLRRLRPARRPALDARTTRSPSARTPAPRRCTCSTARTAASSSRASSARCWRWKAWTS